MKNLTKVRTSDRTDRRKRPSSDPAQDRLTIQHRLVDTLRLDPRNPREHSKKQVAQTAESIRAFGFNVPNRFRLRGTVQVGGSGSRGFFTSPSRAATVTGPP